MSNHTARDQKYLQFILDRLDVCHAYQPQLGQGQPVSLEGFLNLYGADPFYAWFGLNNPLIYAAHKAAGGITSIYRQIGIGCEVLFQHILMDELNLTSEQAQWSYTVSSGLRERTLTLDGRILLADVQAASRQQTIRDWMYHAAQQLGVDDGIRRALKGCVFEVRQGYKSKDSKRQNADIANGSAAYKAGYLPVVVLLSTQIDEDLASRYLLSGLLLLRGLGNSDPLNSTYAFCRDVVGYDLAKFFERNADALRYEIQSIVEKLLTA
ncbi:MAG: hypothetical protein JXA10_00615 [Anaerolineae bacterium]|nr:hypothetical protein [Anaerolineae bacterium]